MPKRISIALFVAAVLLAFTQPQQHKIYVPLVYWSAASEVSCLGQIECVVYEDADGNGERGPNEIGMPDVLLTLQSLDRDNKKRAVRSDSFGECLVGVQPGRYVLQGKKPDGYRWTTPDAWGIDIVCATIHIDFGLQPIPKPESSGLNTR